MFKKLLIAALLTTSCFFAKDIEQAQLKNELLIDGLTLFKEYKTDFNDNKNNLIVVKYKNCTFFGRGKPDLGDGNNAHVKGILSEALCKKDLYTNEYYKLIGDIYSANAEEKDLPAKVQWFPGKRKIELTVIKDTPVKIKIDMILSKEILSAGNYTFNYIITKNNQVVEHQHYSYGNIIDIHLTKETRCSKTKYFTTGFVLKCKDNLYGNKSVPCQLVSYKVKDYSEEIARNVNEIDCENTILKQLSKIYNFNILLGESGQEEIVYLDDGYNLNYNYFFTPLD